MPGYLYATAGKNLYVNLFMASQADIPLEGGSVVRIVQETDYPWSGSVRLKMSAGAQLRLLLRVPGWARGKVLGGELYRFEQPANYSVSIRINGAAVEYVMEKGYAVLSREWRDGDIVDLDLPMPVRAVVCDERVAANRGKAALQRGPLVYCVEGRDAAMPLESLQLDGQAARHGTLEPRWEPELLGGVMSIRGPGFMANPYYAWANRGAGPMRVWLARQDA